ncbi:MAG: hypothetical protein AAF677_09435 [Pseudomonadota bacterium]
MRMVATAALAALIALPGMGSATTLDFSNAVFDATDDSFLFSGVLPGTNLRVTSDGIASKRTNGVEDNANNISLGPDLFQVNLRSFGGNRTELTFSLESAATGAPVAVSNLEISVLDIDFTGRERVELLSPASYTLSDPTNIVVDLSDPARAVFTNPTDSNATNPVTGDLAALNGQQAGAALRLNLGTVSSFTLALGVGGNANRENGRNFLFGNFTFADTVTTTTDGFSPVPLPAPGLALILAIGLLGAHGAWRGRWAGSRR